MQLKAVSVIFAFNFPHPSSVIVSGVLRVEVMALFLHTSPLSSVSLSLNAGRRTICQQTPRMDEGH